MYRTSLGEAIAIFIPHEEPVASEIVYVNDAFVGMSGFRAEQLVGHSAMLLAGSRPDPELARAAVAASRAGRPFARRERKFRPDGSFYDVDVRLEVLGGAASGPARIVLFQRLVR